MLQMAQILLPVDFSENCKGAARYAGMLACRWHSELTMLHVVPKSEYPIVGMEAPPDFFELRRAVVSEADKNLDAFLNEELRGLSVKRLVVEGDPASEIVKTAHATRSDLIVMPTHGYGPFRRFLLGSVTAKVLHDADCPVLTGVHMEKGPTQAAVFRNILCAVDLGPQSTAALTWAGRIAEELGANLNVIHVLPPVEVGQARYFDQQFNAAVQRSARDAVEELQNRVGTHATVIIDNGDVSKIVHGAAESLKSDLVVIGRHVDAGILGRLRTHAYAIVREAPCPVLSV